jgi:hypothetical protein
MQMVVAAGDTAFEGRATVYSVAKSKSVCEWRVHA